MFRKILMVLLCALLLTPTAFSQFGRNKVQYTEFNWRVIDTEHFELYYYEEEVLVANIAADFAERSFEFLTEKYGHSPTKKIALIVYSDPSHFHQTNTVPMLLP
ncbi:MAG: hypothetical protein U9Q97_04970, partial [Acidobacteriota bacterium]|nr:hypothetical protein [Acidobacteriota bacterium]